MSFYPTKGQKKIASIPVVDNGAQGLTGREETSILVPDEELANRKYVINTQNNATGINTDRSYQVVMDLKGYAEGSALICTYYKEHYAESDVHSKSDETDITVHNVHNSILKIHNFELRMTGPLQYEHDAANNISKVSGEALTYPGFRPEKGDLFVMEVDTGKNAIMQVVEEPVRTAIRASTYYKITFILSHWADTEHIEAIESAITDEAWFDKTRFLNEPGALLYHDEYIELKYLKHQRARMIKYHTAKFLDMNLMFSYNRPDKIHDPYVTDFLLRTLEHTEVGYRPVQLYRDAPYMETSVWKAILDEHMPLEAVPTAASVGLHRIGSKSVKHNALTNKEYVYWVKSQSLADLFASLNPSGEGEGESGSETPEGEIPPDDSIPDYPEGTTNEERTIGDLLLHLHPHYRECMGDGSDDDGSGSGSGTGDLLDLILGGSDEHVRLLMMFLLTRQIDLRLLHACIEQIWKLPLLDQFYKMPIYEFLAYKAQSYIQGLAGLIWER